ncbi:MAG: acyl carrier protein [Proteobacteria bacterium]|nr:acyl carrier protein [Pseudomonadota bacterium]
MEKEEIFEAVKEALVDVLGVDEDDVTMDSSFYDDLGAESLDMLDLFFRIESKTNIRISMSEVQKVLQGDLSEEEFFDENGIVTPAGLEHLQKLLPDSNLAEIAEELDQVKLFSLFTVRQLVEIIADKASKSGNEK